MSGLDVTISNGIYMTWSMCCSFSGTCTWHPSTCIWSTWNCCKYLPIGFMYIVWWLAILFVN